MSRQLPQALPALLLRQLLAAALAVLQQQQQLLPHEELLLWPATSLPICPPLARLCLPASKQAD